MFVVIYQTYTNEAAVFDAYNANTLEVPFELARPNPSDCVWMAPTWAPPTPEPEE